MSEQNDIDENLNTLMVEDDSSKQHDSGCYEKEPNHKKWLTWATVFSLIFVPLTVAVISGYVAYQSSKDKNATEYIKLGISILNDKPDKNNKATREWAIDLINYYAPVKIPQSTQDELSSTTVLPVSGIYQALGIKAKKVTHVFKWLNNYHSYSFELQKFDGNKWQEYTYMSMLGNSSSLEIPTNVQLRWRARGLSPDGTLSDFEWQNLIYK